MKPFQMQSLHKNSDKLEDGILSLKVHGMWPTVTDRKVKRDKRPIIIKDHIHKQISVLGKKLQNIPLVSGNKEQAITLLVDTFNQVMPLDFKLFKM